MLKVLLDGVLYDDATVLASHYVLLGVWLSDNAMVSINEVSLRHVRFVLGWVTVYGRVNQLGMYPVTQVNSAWSASVSRCCE